MTTETVEVPPDVWGRAVEVAAEALYEHGRDRENYGDAEFDWPNIDRAYDKPDETITDPEWARNEVRADTRAVLAAALPVLLADLADRIETQANLGPEHWDSGVEFATGLVRSFAAEVSR